MFRKSPQEAQVTGSGAPLTPLYVCCAVCDGIATVHGMPLIEPAPLLGIALLFGRLYSIAVELAA